MWSLEQLCTGLDVSNYALMMMIATRKDVNLTQNLSDVFPKFSLQNSSFLFSFPPLFLYIYFSFSLTNLSARVNQLRICKEM